MDSVRIIELEKENFNLKQELSEKRNNNDLLQHYQNHIQRLTEEILFLKERLTNQAIVFNVNAKKTWINESETLKFKYLKERPMVLKVPVSVIRIAGVTELNEISPPNLNALVSQVEAELKDRFIVLVNM